MSAIGSILRQVCPRCHQGPIFRVPIWRGWLDMHRQCPVCGLKFIREQGYFVGALYFNYFMSAPPMFVLFLLLFFGAGWSYRASLLGAFLIFLPAIPIVVRYSRVVWIYFDQALEPEPTPGAR